MTNAIATIENNNANAAYYTLITDAKLYAKFSELKDAELKINLDREGVYTTELDGKATKQALLQMAYAGLFA